MLTDCLEVLSSLLFESEFAPPSSLPGRAMPADRISQFIDLSFSRSPLFLFPDSRCDSRSLLTWRPGSNQSSIKLISHSGERGRDERTNYKSHSWPLLSSIKAKRCRRPRPRSLDSATHTTGANFTAGAEISCCSFRMLGPQPQFWCYFAWTSPNTASISN